ncbi:hypothetical protein J3458_000356 [Metarhizium acridum]|uniref:Uncharacterized protein n=1 Tax=Metarhizium acridum (strain CQMa 102) TaxID=655827 RepID=E9E0J4_METAQ|nr:uncharacterized protein MAC_03392 [Metarhizium acridum CQMa 102]EFY90614.1 hypothetical protein MAC_03392 [Metarhizium acridum CQMa 102]KAG8423462.1 hypothetical protein J3458_000356 [Metarhizium acridum]
MAPETRSRGVPPPSRVYNSSPALQQVQFPARRKKIRRCESSERPSLKQQTLTQIDFVSSFGEDVITLSDSDDDVQDGDLGSEDKENVKPGLPDGQDQNAQEEGEKVEEEEEDVEEPVSMRRKRAAPSIRQGKKRRRTMGDEANKAITSRKEDKSRRKTLADMPTCSNYHTQTLTQFLGHQTSFVADSDDDLDLDKDGDDGFLSWLGEPGSPSAGRGKRHVSPPAMKRRHEETAAFTASAADLSMSREDSVIPQTPAKKKTCIRFDLPSEGLQSPSERMVERYGAPDQQDSPLKNHSSPMKPPPVKLTGEPRRASPGVTKQSSLVIQDSYTTDGCTTPSKNQAKISQIRTPTPLRLLLDTPSILNPVGDDDTPTKRRRPWRESPSPKKLAAGRGLYEIPDSDEDDDEFGEEEDEDDGKSIDKRYGAGVETQLVLSELASTEENQHSCQDAVPCSPPTSTMHTQAEPVSATVQYEQQSTANQPVHAFSTSSRPTTPPRPKPIRKPLAHLSGHTQIQSQPWESQRVHVSILQSLPAPSAKSDILLPVSTSSLEGLITGNTLHVASSFKIPSQVVRFWLFENSLLRYMASVEPGQQVQAAGSSSSSSSSSQGKWRFHATQVYELNNPVCEDDMRQEGWLRGQITRYKYLPPAVIGQLLWNLRHALFADQPSEQQQVASSPVRSSPQPKLPQGDGKDRARNRAPGSTPPGSMTVSQQITAQIHSDIASSTQFPTSDDMVPSTPDSNEPLKLRSSSRTTTLPAPPAPRQPSRTVRPSQATTLSQPPTPEGQTQQQPASMPPPPPFDPSQSSVQFAESSHLSSLPIPSSPGSTSQLLTKSQMLPDSLIQDHTPPVQPEIWDSDEEDVSL